METLLKVCASIEVVVDVQIRRGHLWISIPFVGFGYPGHIWRWGVGGKRMEHKRDGK